MRDFHVKAPNGESTFNYSYGATCEDGRTRVIPICEHIYFTALGGGKTSMWYKVQEKIAKPEKSAIKGNDKAERDRASFKSARVKAFISRFLSGCEMPPPRPGTWKICTYCRFLRSNNFTGNMKRPSSRITFGPSMLPTLTALSIPKRASPLSETCSMPSSQKHASSCEAEGTIHLAKFASMLQLC